MHADRFITSPNFGERKNGLVPQYIILHFTVIDDLDEACEFLCDPAREVSAHYVLGKDGQLAALVEESQRAWHAGASYWAGHDDLNSRSIGIEIVNNGARPFEEAQYERLIPLIRDVKARWNIPAENVLGHSDIALGRKFDPGPWFDWKRLDDASVSSAPMAKIMSNDFLELARSAGYDARAPLADILTNLRIRHGATPYFGELRESDLALLVNPNA